MKQAPKIITIRKAKNPRHGVDIYARVASRSREGVEHVVTIAVARTRTRCHCGCEAAGFNSRKRCDHIKVVRERAVRRGWLAA